MKNFKKEIITLIFILVLVSGLDFITSKIMKNIVKEINFEVSNVEKNNNDENMKKLKDKWQERENKLSFFIEHDELEKVTIELTSLESNIENNVEEEIKENINKIKFLLNHIEEKEKFKMKNIF